MNDSLPEPRYIVLHIGTGPSRLEAKSGSQLIVRNRRRFQLTDDIWIERLGKRIAKRVQRACDPPHHNIRSIDPDRHLYAFIRRVAGVEKTKYEGVTELNAVIALSRLINPTSTGDRYCAQVFRYGAKDSPIFAIRFRGVSP